MIEAKTILTIVAWDDAEADAVYSRIHAALSDHGLHAEWPRTPIVNLHEVERKFRPTTELEEQTHHA